MIQQTKAEEFNQLSRHHPVIDTRSPAEFRQGHIPGAVNIPLFDDDERATVGTLYHKSGHDLAILKGLDIALEKMDSFYEQVLSYSGRGTVLLYCWRGGMRSATMAEIFHYTGLEVRLLTGGYKAWRKFIRSEIEKPRKAVVTGGYTGSGKTGLLKALSAIGEQVIDLEALASHKGSVFGALGQKNQPTNEQFENDFFSLLEQCDPSKPLWLEDESRMIGNVTLPDPLYNMLITSPLILVRVDRETRLENLVAEYAGFDKELLAAALAKIGQRIGGDQLKKAIACLEISDFHSVADIVLKYYDKAYDFSLSRRQNKICPFEIRGNEPETDASNLRTFYLNHLS